MPNIPDRERHEQEIIAALLPVMAAQRQRVLGAEAGREPFAEFQRGLRQALENRLAEVYLQAADQLNEIAERDVPEGVSRPGRFAFFTDARTWAAGLIAILLPSLIEVTIERIEIARNATQRDISELGDEFQAQDAATQAEIRRRTLDARLDSAFGNERIETIAITEVTRANTSGETGAIRRIQQQVPLVAIAFWLTERDELVCPICGPNDGKHEREWRDQFPKGPASTHPRCRCEVIYQFFAVDAPEAQDAIFAASNLQAELI